jgi:hypothetical protein
MPRRIIGVGHGTLDAVFPRYGGAALTLPALTVSASDQGGGTPITDFLFQSDFGFGTGSSQSIDTDGGKWSGQYADNGDGMEVIASSGLDFPSTNVLRITAQQAASGLHRISVTGLGTLANDTSRWYRYYYRNEMPTSGDNSTHPIETGQTPTLEFSFNCEVVSDTTWRLQLRPGGDQGDADLARWSSPLLDRSVSYRCEWQIHKQSSTEFLAHVRVYDAATESLLYQDEDFRNDNGGLSPETPMTLADTPTLHFSTADGSQMDELRAGINGIAGTDWYPSILYGYQGCFAVRDGSGSAGWCGEYIAGEGMA